MLSLQNFIIAKHYRYHRKTLSMQNINVIIAEHHHCSQTKHGIMGHALRCCIDFNLKCTVVSGTCLQVALRYIVMIMVNPCGLEYIREFFTTQYTSCERKSVSSKPCMVTCGHVLQSATCSYGLLSYQRASTNMQLVLSHSICIHQSPQQL